MPATSPYSGNDYQAASNFRPYELPINDIFKAWSAQNQFWEAGASKVKAVYDDALNLKLSKEPNKEIRRKYMEDAQKQLTKLSSMDLSDPSVQRKGFSLFKPLFQDEGIIYDDLATRHFDKVRNDALSYRTKDNGKEYSDVNMQYAMDGYEDFLNSDDRMAGKAAYSKRREYTPFHDYTDDFSKALKDCHPSSIETQSPVYSGDKKDQMSGYAVDVYAKKLSVAQANGCLEGISPKAMRQLQIEGAVAYKNNPQVLAADTQEYLGMLNSNTADRLAELSTNKLKITNDPNIPANEKAQVLAELDQQIKGASDNLTTNKNYISKLQKGDYTDLLNNFDGHAGNIYSFKKLYKKALSSAYEESRQKYVDDPVQMNAIKFLQEKELQQIDFRNDISMQQMKNEHDLAKIQYEAMYGNKTGSGSGKDLQVDPVTGMARLSPNLEKMTGVFKNAPDGGNNIYNDLNTKISDINREEGNNEMTIFNKFMERGDKDPAFKEAMSNGFVQYPEGVDTVDEKWAYLKRSGNRFNTPDGTGAPITKTSWFKAYSQTNPKDEDLDKWASQNMAIGIGRETLNRKLQLGEAEVTRNLGGNLQTQLQNGLKEIKPTNVAGTNLTAQDVQNAIEGKGGAFTITKTPYTGVYATSGTIETQFNINGRPLQGAEREKALKLYNAVQDKNGAINKKVSDERQRVYNKLGFDREAWFFTPGGDKNAFVQSIQTLFPNDDKGKSADIDIIGSNFAGGVKIKIPGAKLGGSNEDILNKLSRIGTSREVTADGEVTIRGTNYNAINQAINNPMIGEAAYQLSTIGETEAFTKTQPGAKVKGADIEVPVRVNGEMKKLTIETHNEGGRPYFRGYMDTKTGIKQVVTADNPYALFEQAAQLRLQFEQPAR